MTSGNKAQNLQMRTNWSWHKHTPDVPSKIHFITNDFVNMVHGWGTSLSVSKWICYKGTAWPHLSGTGRLVETLHSTTAFDQNLIQ